MAVPEMPNTEHYRPPGPALTDPFTIAVAVSTVPLLVLLIVGIVKPR